METNMKCEKGYVVLPVEEYNDLKERDLCSFVSVGKASKDSWGYGDVRMYISQPIIARAVESIKDKIDPEAVIKVNDINVIIANVPKEIMDKRLGKAEDTE